MVDIQYDSSAAIPIALLFSILKVALGEDDREASMKQARILAKPFLLRDFHIPGTETTLPFSPVTIIIFVVSSIVLLRGLNRSDSATASHILLDDDSEATKEKLEQYKKEINNDLAKFREYAAKYSKCPSGKSAGGSLGTFGRGSMVPPFDKAIFDRNTVVGEVVGPVRTSFGFHLILVEERTLV